MPIRRAAATPTLEKPVSATAEKGPEDTPAESPSAEEEQPASSAEAGVTEAKPDDTAKPTENGEKADEGAADKSDDGTDKKDLSAESEKCKDCVAGQCATHCYVLLPRLKDGYKYKKSKVKKVKRTIPVWASVSARKKLPVANYSGTHNRLDHLLIEAITSFDDRAGVSYQSVMKYIAKKCPDMELDKKKFHIKKAMKKQLEKGTIKQLKGKGLSGTFTIGKQTSGSKRAVSKQGALGDALPLIITRLCEPKEASYPLIKKYLEQHFPSLNVENRPEVLKSALVKAVERGQLEQITGKGASGTFQLKRTGNQVLLKGGTLEDAILAAITAMNEPKTCSTTTLRKYLVDANKDTKEYQLVANLRRTLTKCKVLGWMEQITGHGFTGTYRLCFPFYPSPTTLYPDKFNKTSTGRSSRSRRRGASDDEDSEEEEEEEMEEEEDEEDGESEEEAPVRKRPVKRPPPKVRHLPTPKKAVGRREAAPAKTSRGKKTPAKKAPKAKTPASKKGSSPVKRRGAAKRPKTPAAKRLTRRSGKPPASPAEDPQSEEEEEPQSEEDPQSEEEPAAAKKRSPAKKTKAASPAKKAKTVSPAKRPAKRGGAKESKREESVPEEPESEPEPEPRKSSGRGTSKRNAVEKSEQPPAKKAAPAGKRNTRTSKRGKN